jgi:hypothetical protein
MKTLLRFQSLCLCVCLALTSVKPAAGLEPKSEQITFAKGSDGTVIKHRIKGDESVDYRLSAKAGQRLLIVLETSNASNYFNVVAPNANEAKHIGSSAGNRFEGKLPVDGEYTIQIYLMRNAARRNETALYSLSVNVFGSGPSIAAPANDFADRLGGGPDFWEVIRVKSGAMFAL